MKRLSRFLARHRWFAWLLFLVLSIPPVLGLSGYNLLESRDVAWSTTGDRETLGEAQSRFTSKLAGVPSLLVIESDEFFQTERVHSLWRTVSQIEQLEKVYGVVWMGSVPQITLFGGRELLLPGREPKADAEQIASAKEQISTHPLIAGQLLSEDGRTLLMGIFVYDRETVQRTVQIAREQLEPHGMTVRLTGPVALRRAHQRTLDAEHNRVLYTAMGLIIGLALLIFRGLPAILITCSGPLLGVFWTLGWLAFVGEDLNELTMVLVPVMAMIIGFTDGVHIVVHVRQERVAGKSQRDAAATAMEQVGLACLLTSLTTAIGFASLLIADATIIQSFGRSSAIAVFVTFVAVVLLVPLLSGSWLGKNIHKGYERDLVGTNIQRLSGLVDGVVRHSRAVAIVGILVTVALAFGASTLQPDNRLAHRIPHNCEEWQAMVHCDEAFGGIHFLRVLVSWEEDTPREEIWNGLLEIEQELDSEKLLGRSLSVRHWLSVLPGAQRPEKLAMTSFLPKEFRNEFWNSDERQAQVVSRMQDLGMATYRPVLDKLELEFRKIEERHPGLKLQITGEAIVENQIVQRVVRELFHSLALAAVIIFLVITVTFRSLRLGLLSIIPNVFPLAATASLRAVFFGTSLDISSACSFAICLGIAVDDTIHFLIRYLHEQESGHEPPEAIHRTFVTVGSALVMTTAVMVSGFGSVMTSSLPTHFLFATMAVTTIAAALIGDLILLPALLMQFPGNDSDQRITE
jgi:uncharacterized protein